MAWLWRVLFLARLAAVESLEAQALGVEDFLNRVVEVNVDGADPPERFFDVLEIQEAGKARPVAPYYKVSAWHGLCLNSEGKGLCRHRYEQRSALQQAYARNQGRKSVAAGLFANVPQVTYTSETSVRIEGEALVVETTKKNPEGGGYRARFRVRRVEPLSQRKIEVATPRTDQSQREGIENSGPSVKRLARAVLQIVRGPFLATDLLGDQVRSGSGFFIADEGLLLSNYHVLQSYPSCLRDLVCTISLRQTDGAGSVKNFKAVVELYAESEGYDFVLLKLNMPSGISFRSLELEEEKLGPEVLTLGYPGDFTDAKTGATRLTLSRGRLTGFLSRALATSAYVFGGASGSPLLNEVNGKVIGLISNTLGPAREGVGAPGLARPIDVIDQRFGLREYINGRKQAQIDGLIAELGETSTASVADELMKQFRRENSLYGVRRLLKIMIDHDKKQVRERIYRGLLELKVIRGSASL